MLKISRLQIVAYVSVRISEDNSKATNWPPVIEGNEVGASQKNFIVLTYRQYRRNILQDHRDESESAMKNLRRFLFLDEWARLEDLWLLLFRIFVGAFLIWGVWDNIVNVERMVEFSAFLQTHHFMYPDILALVSVWVQFACGLSFIFGIFVRWGGIFCAVNFVVALVMVDAENGLRQAFPAAMLVFFAGYLATRGGGRFSSDAMLCQLVVSDNPSE